MKTKLFAYALLLLTVVIGVGACNKNETTTSSGTVSFTATLKGAVETPPNTSTATGMANFTFNKTTKILSGTVTFSGITTTAAHIHKGAVGVPGGVIFPLGTAPFTSPINFTSAALDSTQEADLMAEMYYVNVHSTQFPDGEIRGQLMKKTTSTTTGGGGY